MGDFEIKLEIATQRDGSVINRLLIVGKDEEIILDKLLTCAHIYPDELIRLGKWQDFVGFKYSVDVVE